MLFQCEQEIEKMYFFSTFLQKWDRKAYTVYTRADGDPNGLINRAPTPWGTVRCNGLGLNISGYL